VETAFGFHIIRREVLMAEEKISGAHILISHQAALRAPRGVTRSLQEARALARDLNGRLAREPANFDSLLRRYSDGPRADRGGGLGLWTTGHAGRPPAIDRALLALPIGGIAPGPVETSFGFHLLKRLKILQPALLSGAHILVSYQGAVRSPASVVRSRAEARVRAHKLHRKLKRKPAAFEDMARSNSDDPSGRVGGDLGSWPPGQLHPKFEAALKDLKPGKLSRPVETPFGFHIIRRVAAK